jgi:hypothetical protein
VAEPNPRSCCVPLSLGSLPGRGRAEYGGHGAGGAGCVQAHDLCPESKVWRLGSKRGATLEATGGRERPAEETGRRPQLGQGDVESGDQKKRIELADRRTEARWLREQYRVSERRVCGLLSLGVSSYRYESCRSDEKLWERVVQLAREKPRFGCRRLHVLLLQRSAEKLNHKRLYRIYRQASLCLRRKKRKHCLRVSAPLRQYTMVNQE